MTREQSDAGEPAGERQLCWVVCFSPLRLEELACIGKSVGPRTGPGVYAAGQTVEDLQIGGGGHAESDTISLPSGPTQEQKSTTPTTGAMLPELPQLEPESEPQMQQGLPPTPIDSWMLQDTVQLVAMGPTTRAAMERLGLPCAASAVTPSPDGIAHAIAAACSKTEDEKGCITETDASGCTQLQVDS